MEQDGGAGMLIGDNDDNDDVNDKFIWMEDEGGRSGLATSPLLPPCCPQGVTRAGSSLVATAAPSHPHQELAAAGVAAESPRGC